MMKEATKKIDKEHMKRSNRQLVFHEIHRSGSISRRQLSKLTGLAPMSVGRIADELIGMRVVGELEENEQETEKEQAHMVGRRPKMLQIVPDRMLSPALELDRNRIRAGIMDIHGRILVQTEHRENLAELTPEEVVELCASQLEELSQRAEKLLQGQREPFEVLGVVCPGIVDSKRGIVRFSSQLQWQDVDFVKMLRERLGIENIQLDNEVKARGQAEATFGAGQNLKRVALLNIGSGVGSCLVIRRKIYRGKGNMAGEIGHVCIDPNGMLCECGQRGCLQTYLSDLSLLQDARKFVPNCTLDTLFAAYGRQETWAINIIMHAVRYVVLAIEMLRNLYAPNIIVLCGKMIESYPQLQQAILDEYRSKRSRYDNQMELAVSHFGKDGNLIGAGTLALNLNFEVKA